jgi:predicted dehydrogenase
MKKDLNRRDFVKTAAAGGIGLGLTGNLSSFFQRNKVPAGKRAGIIGLDTSHSVAYSKTLNNPEAGPEYDGYKIVAAYPKGSNDIKSSVDRIPGYIEDVKKLGVEIVNSIDELIKKVDVIFLETNDGRLHLEQALPVLKAGKRMFIDKPIAASLTDAIAIFNASNHYKTPVFSSSSLRYINGVKEISEGSVGKVIGVDTFSPSSIEPTHPDLFWYGIHGVEVLFTIMGKGCKSVTRVHTADTDFAVGTWNDNRIGTFRGIRSGKSGYGGNVFGDKGIVALGGFAGYDPLLVKVIEFFNTGNSPVTQEETIDIFAFMQAAEESKFKGGCPVQIEEVMQKATREAKKNQYK